MGADIRLSFTDGFTLRTVRDGLERLRGAHAHEGLVELDCSAVEECDLSGAQLIISALRTAQRDGRQVRIVPPQSGVLQQTLSRAGLADAYEALVATCAPSIAEGRAQ